MKVAAVIPAYNEEETVGSVVRAIRESDLVDEIIVVSDGSQDKTVREAREAQADKVLWNQINRGKGAALDRGVAETSAKVILFCDADLLGFKGHHVRQLLSPVLLGKRYMNIGLRDRSRLYMFLAHHLPLISGERAFNREVFEGLLPRMKRGFMVEAAMNYYCRSRSLSYGAIPLKGVTIRRKYQKMGMLAALAGYAKLNLEVIWSYLYVRILHYTGRW